MITEYFRPRTLDEAIDLIARPDAVALAGGTSVVPSRLEAPSLAVDLQDLGLGGIAIGDGVVTVGAMTTLGDLATNDDVPSELADLAGREVSPALRNLATVGGTIVAGGWESQLIAGLLAFGTDVTIASLRGETVLTLDELLDRGVEGSLITAIKVPVGGKAATERTARTPLDTPIVAAVAHQSIDGDVTLALSGVADLPIVVDPDDVAGLEPPGDFRGSSGYRRHLAVVLSGRALARIGGV